MARERASLARESYEAGGIDFMRLQQVLDGATEAERALVQRRFDYYRALVELEAAVGRPVDRREG
jgi:outer membrane protein TolC